jgi:hypothetical protein
MVLGFVAAVLWWRGSDYYPLGLDDRVEHPDYRTLRSSGHIGYGYGVAGALLIFANLLYLARRRFARWNLGSMKTWLDIHVFTGLAGALFVSFHSTFKARTTISKVTSLSLLLVVVTGLIGRFLYALVPSSGDADLRKALAELDEISPGLGQQATTLLAEHKPPRPTSGSLLRALATIPSWRRINRARREALALVIDNARADLPDAERARLKGAAKRLQRESRRAVRAVGASAILRSWRAMHRFFAILMLLTVVFHIGVAWYYGYRWIWSE